MQGLPMVSAMLATGSDLSLEMVCLEGRFTARTMVGLYDAIGMRWGTSLKGGR